MEKAKMKMVGALWTTVSKKGLKFLTGKVNDQRIIIFKTLDKKNERSPDYIIYESNTVPPAKRGSAQGSAGKAPLDEEPQF